MSLLCILVVHTSTSLLALSHREAIQDSAAAAQGPQMASSVIAIKEREERRKELKVGGFVTRTKNIRLSM